MEIQRQSDYWGLGRKRVASFDPDEVQALIKAPGIPTGMNKRASEALDYDELDRAEEDGWARDPVNELPELDVRMARRRHAESVFDPFASERNRWHQVLDKRMPVPSNPHIRRPGDLERIEQQFIENTQAAQDYARRQEELYGPYQEDPEDNAAYLAEQYRWQQDQEKAMRSEAPLPPILQSEGRGTLLHPQWNQVSDNPLSMDQNFSETIEHNYGPGHTWRPHPVGPGSPGANRMPTPLGEVYGPGGELVDTILDYEAPGVPAAVPINRQR